MTGWWKAAAAAALAAGVLALGAPRARAETVELMPEQGADWGLRNVFAPLSVLFLGPSFYYGDREIRVDTAPPGAHLDLFYVRANFQKRYEQTAAPATIVLPTRIDAGPRDSVTIRAFLEGYKIQDVTVRVGSRTEDVTIDLSPLPNTLKAVAHTTFAGRSTLSLFTSVVPTVRMQDRKGGYTVVLNQTAKSPEVAQTLEAVRSSVIQKVDAQQLGEDLLVRIDLTPEAAAQQLELRSRTAVDAARGLQEYAIDLVRPGSGGGLSADRALAALARIDERDVTGCALSFDAELRDALGAEALSRALAPRGGFTEPYLRGAMKRLGELSPGGVVTMLDGTRWNPSVPLELSAATSQAALAKGYLSLLRAFSRHLAGADEANETLRGLVAPELDAQSFESALGRAAGRERVCRG
jgi:hypothetical protein